MVFVPTDVELPQHPHASRAELHRAGGDWVITFYSGQSLTEEAFAIAPDTLADAGVDPSQERLVTGYLETRLLAAGYGISTWDEKPPTALGGWALTR